VHTARVDTSKQKGFAQTFALERGALVLLVALLAAEDDIHERADVLAKHLNLQSRGHHVNDRHAEGRHQREAEVILVPHVLDASSVRVLIVQCDLAHQRTRKASKQSEKASSAAVSSEDRREIKA
jgi:hypothetical protein